MVEWEITTIGCIADFEGGSQPPLSTFTNQEKYGYIRLIQIRDYKTDKYSTYVPTQLAKRFCTAEDIMIGRYGPPIFQILRGIKGAYNVALIKTIPKDVDREFLYYTLLREDLFNYIELLSRRSSGQTGVDLENLRMFEISLPPLPEQRHIAAALSDTDALIAALEKLIAKKRNIKQGVMQELLTGKRRLLGFSGEWVEQKVSDFGDVITGATPSTYILKYWNGDIPWVTPTDITEKKDIYTTERMITANGLSVIRKLPADTLLITCIASIGKNIILRNVGASNQQINAIVPNTDNDVDFLYYLFELNKIYMLGKAGQTATNIISKQDFSTLSFVVPNKIEQTAIAAVLSDMDAEIDALTAKLAKLKHIKKGMMSELLTGRIRLS